MVKKGILTVLLLDFCILSQGCSNVDLTVEPEIVVEDHSGEDIILFEIYFDRPMYHIQDDIPVEMRFMNQGSKPVMVNGNVGIIYPNSGEDVSIVFDIRDPSGEILPYGFYPHIIRDVPSYFPILEPHEEMILIAKLNGFYNFTEPGEYIIRAEYNNTIDHPDGRPAWKGTVESNVVTIEITP